MRSSSVVAMIALALSLVSSACASGPRARVQSAVLARDLPAATQAYERFRAVDGDDVALLGRVASLVLRAAALSEDESLRDVAFAELRGGGVAAMPTLRELARAESPRVRAQANAGLLKLGDRSAAPYLAALADDADPALRALALPALDVDADASIFLRALADPDAGLRRAAAAALLSAAPQARMRLALAEVARADPERMVRAAATRALGAQGEDAVEALRGRLSDPFSSVRLAAVGALLRADPAAGAAAVGALLATPPSPAGIEAARRLSELSGAMPADQDAARVYLRAALAAHETTLRSQAAVALTSLAQPALDDDLRRALAREQDVGVRLGLARALLRRDEATSLPVLRELLQGAGMPALQAASLLAARGERDAIAHLEASLHGGSPLSRRVALRALAVQAGEPYRLLEFLGDEDAHVRLRAAGAILAAAHP